MLNTLNAWKRDIRWKWFHRRWKTQRYSSLLPPFQGNTLFRSYKAKMKRLVYNRTQMLFSSLLLLSLFLAFVTPENNASESPSYVASRQNNKHFLLPSSIYTKGPLKLFPTVKKSSSTVVTKIETTSVVCAKLVNVTGPCLRRRGAWVEEPIVLSFHGDFDDAFDLKYSPVLR